MSAATPTASRPGSTAPSRGRQPEHNGEFEPDERLPCDLSLGDRQQIIHRRNGQDSDSCRQYPLREPRHDRQRCDPIREPRQPTGSRRDRPVETVVVAGVGDQQEGDRNPEKRRRPDRPEVKHGDKVQKPHDCRRTGPKANDERDADDKLYEYRDDAPEAGVRQDDGLEQRREPRERPLFDRPPGSRLTQDGTGIGADPPRVRLDRRPPKPWCPEFPPAADEQLVQQQEPDEYTRPRDPGTHLSSTVGSIAPDASAALSSIL